MVAPKINKVLSGCNCNMLGGYNGTYEDFRNALGDRESSNNYTIVNSYGYMGRYQFGQSTLASLYNKYNLPNWQSRSYFLAHPEIQDQYFDALVQENAAVAAPLLMEAKSRYGDQITLSGLVAAAHLKGAGGMRSYVHGNDNADANGTYTSDYAEQFSGYDIPNYPEDVGAEVPANLIDPTNTDNSPAMAATPILIGLGLAAALALLL